MSYVLDCAKCGNRLCVVHEVSRKTFENCHHDDLLPVACWDGRSLESNGGFKTQITHVKCYNCGMRYSVQVSDTDGRYMLQEAEVCTKAQ